VNIITLDSYCLGRKGCTERIKQPNIFGIHGLWPMFESEERIPECNTGDKINVDPLGETRDIMEVYWTSLKGDNIDFWEYEYNKHGHCLTERYKLANEQIYFDGSVKIYQTWALDQLMTHALGDIKMKSSDALEFSFEELTDLIQNARKELYFTIRCLRFKGKQYLNDIRIYFDLEFNPLDHEQATNCKMEENIYITFDN
jgi:ribonuclease I